MGYLNNTIEYYSALANISPRDFFTSKETLYVSNPLLDKPLKGYAKSVDILIYEKTGKYIISYSQRGKGFLRIFQGDGPENALNSKYCKRKFYYGGGVASLDGVASCNTIPRMLTEKDYPDFLEFYKAINPGSNKTDWLPEYFSAITEKRRCFGAYTHSGIIAAATDSPDLPIMEETFCEIGINTLPDYRRQGLAFSVCTLQINSLLSQGITPLWSAREDNIASRKLAEKLGFRELMRVIELSL